MTVLRLTLTHLTFLGASVEPATVEFGPQLTLIRGPSDTGKSFIVSAIDFMLGASNLKEIPEREGYSTVLLGLRLADDRLITLSRPATGGAFGLYLSDVRQLPLPIPDETLGFKHNPKNEKNLSRFLLKQIGLEDKHVRKNARNATDTLSFRNLAHLCLVDETQMQAETPPALTGQYTTRTKEVSVLKLLLQTEDDSHLIEQETKQDASRLDGVRMEVIDRLLAQVEAQLSATSEESQLKEQLGRLNDSIEQQSGAVSGLNAERNGVTERLRQAQNTFNAARTAFSEITALQGRFGLLRNQYESDLQRLATINEAGSLLDYFNPGRCAFCGAEREHQHYNLECEGDETTLHASIGAEAAKTRALRDDLLLTLNDIATRLSDVQSVRRAARIETRELEARLQELDEQLEPQDSDLRELLAIRREVEKSLGLYERIAELQRMKNQIEDDTDTDTKAVSVGVSLATIREFSMQLSMRLKAWGYPEADSVRYDRTEQDIQTGDQLRSSHGKGVRAILHAAFTIGLAQYCFDRDIAHPGFVVLDSPLVTYRPPDSADTDEAVLDASLPAGVVEAFFRDVQSHFDGQILVFENLDPTEELHDDSLDVPFTHRRNLGRYGFFPMDRGRQGLLVEEKSD